MKNTLLLFSALILAPVFSFSQGVDRAFDPTLFLKKNDFSVDFRIYSYATTKLFFVESDGREKELSLKRQIIWGSDFAVQSPIFQDGEKTCWYHFERLNIGCETNGIAEHSFSTGFGRYLGIRRKTSIYLSPILTFGHLTPSLFSPGANLGIYAKKKTWDVLGEVGFAGIPRFKVFSSIALSPHYRLCIFADQNKANAEFRFGWIGKGERKTFTSIGLQFGVQGFWGGSVFHKSPIFGINILHRAKGSGFPTI